MTFLQAKGRWPAELKERRSRAVCQFMWTFDVREHACACAFARGCKRGQRNKVFEVTGLKIPDRVVRICPGEELTRTSGVVRDTEGRGEDEP